MPFPVTSLQCCLNQTWGFVTTMNASTFRRVANVDGTLTAIEDARISVLDRGFLYGDSVYEVFRTYNGVPLFYEEHLDRLENSARLIHMPLSQSRDDLTKQIRETVAASHAVPGDEVYVRYHVTRGVGPIELYARQTCEPALWSWSRKFRLGNLNSGRVESVWRSPTCGAIPWPPWIPTSRAGIT